MKLIPSHTIFFNRCTFACVSCQNYDIVYDDDYKAIPKELAERIDRRFRQGSRNVNFVEGNPDQHAHTILEILSYVKSNVPVVWNSNMYHSVDLPRDKDNGELLIIRHLVMPLECQWSNVAESLGDVRFKCFQYQPSGV